jgi:nucleotide sugar dehydrogenase
LASITVVALGKIGLPLAVQFASRGHSVVGCDVNGECVEQVNRGVVPFPGEAGLDERLADVVSAGLLSATVDTTSAVAQSDAVVIVVPLFVDGAGVPDFGWMDAATMAVGRGLRAGTLVSYETTLPVGTTRNRFAPMLETESGLVVGDDFALAFSPERVLTGRVFSDLRRYPKLVGGYSGACGTRAVEFYSQVLEFDDRPELPRSNGVWDLGSCEASEMAKLAETTYRDVNIGLANQFARFAAENNIDIFSVIEACNTQPYSHIHQPGIAVGGHCIPIYPQMYLWNDPSATIVRAAREANWSMPKHGVDLLERAHGTLRGQRVGVFGVSYRGAVKESAFSGVFPLVEELTKRGASVVVHDPMYTKDEIVALGFSVFDGSAPVDAAIIQADHPEYLSFSAVDFGNPRTLLNGRNMPLTASVPVILSLGRPTPTSV